jgi:hypothetical protein
MEFLIFRGLHQSLALGTK